MKTIVLKNGYFGKKPAIRLEFPFDFEDWMRNKRYSESTIKTYRESIGLFIRFLRNKPLVTIDNEDFEKFNKEYIIERHYSASFQNQVVNAVKLFFQNRQQRKLDIGQIYRPKRPKTLPNVLSKEEISKILKAPSNLKHRLILMLLYSCGLRRGELLSLKFEHIQKDRGILVVKQGKGKKDRVVPFPAILLKHLEDYRQAYRPVEYVFEGQKGGKYSEKSLAEDKRVTCNAKTMKKIYIILIGFLCVISCKSEGKERNLTDQKVETDLLPQPTNNDTLYVENYDLIFLRPSEEEFNRLVEVHGEDSGLNEVDSDFGFYASKVNDSLSSTDLKVQFATEKNIKMDSEKGVVIINRDEMDNAAFGMIFNHTKCYPTIEFGVMTDLEIYQRIADQKEKCR